MLLGSLVFTYLLMLIMTACCWACDNSSGLLPMGLVIEDVGDPLNDIV